MSRQLSRESIDALKAREGLRLTAYQDQGGTWTIGYGHTGADVHQGLDWTQAQADDAFIADTNWACEAVEKYVGVSLTDTQFGALVSFCYNVGQENFKNSTLVRKLNKGDYASVPDEFLRWVKVKGVRDDGLVNRRNSEGGQWTKGAYVRGAAITPDTPPPWWKTPAVAKASGAISGAAATAYSHLSTDTLQKAADTAQSAAQHWHQFGTVAAVITGALVLWMLVEKKA